MSDHQSALSVEIEVLGLNVHIGLICIQGRVSVLVTAKMCKRSLVHLQLHVTGVRAAGAAAAELAAIIDGMHQEAVALCVNTPKHGLLTINLADPMVSFCLGRGDRTATEEQMILMNGVTEVAVARVCGTIGGGVLKARAVVLVIRRAPEATVGISVVAGIASGRPVKFEVMLVSMMAIGLAPMVLEEIMAANVTAVREAILVMQTIQTGAIYIVTL